MPSLNRVIIFPLILLWSVSVVGSESKGVSKPKYDIEQKQAKGQASKKSGRIAWYIGDVFSYSTKGKQASYGNKPHADVYKTLNAYSATGIVADSYRKGMILAIEQINAQGGVAGKPLEIISKDDKSDAGTARKVVKQLIEHDDVSVIIGTMDDGISDIVSIEAEKQKRLFLSLGRYAQAQKGKEYTYALRPSAKQWGEVLGQEALKSGVSRWIVLLPTDRYGEALLQGFKTTLMKENKKATVLVQDQPAFQPITSETLIKMAQAKPEGVLLAVYGQDLVSLMSIKANARALFFDERVVLCVFCGSSDWNYYIGKKIPTEWKITSPMVGNTQSKAYKDFASAYKKRYKQEPLEIAVIAYTAVYVAKYYIQQKAEKKPMDENAILKGMRIQSPWGTLEFEKDYTPLYKE